MIPKRRKKTSHREVTTEERRLNESRHSFATSKQPQKTAADSPKPGRFMMRRKTIAQPTENKVDLELEKQLE
jgi:hypothetical protein